MWLFKKINILQKKNLSLKFYLDNLSLSVFCEQEFYNVLQLLSYNCYI